MAAANAVEKLLFVSGAANSGIRSACRSQCVSVAPAQSRFPEPCRVLDREFVRARYYRSVKRLNAIEDLFDELIVNRIATSGKPRKRMIEAEENSLLIQPGDQRFCVVTPVLNLKMLLFVD